ncbi:hypothetical protein KY5_7919c [Streptomyces formicae]|uniref:Uncharacterized protein n=1 Tax=Streptomyces formicae TaxID=1616117 RepID=A0A291QN29_9ACTN|nr:hypothetical protein KY5_7919c [Streptomyces formicae]
MEAVDVHEWQDIRFHVDGREFGADRYDGPGPRGNNGPLDIGRACEGEDVRPLTVTVAEVRLWSTAPDAARLGTPVSPHDRGLAAHWRFEENAGNAASDATGSHPARLRGARWVRNPDPRGSSFRLYRNGTPVACDPLANAEFTDVGDRQLTLGARLKHGRGGQAYSGVLEDVRIWRTARTHKQVLDNLFTRLTGEKQDLIAYWPFDDVSTRTATRPTRPRSSS